MHPISRESISGRVSIRRIWLSHSRIDLGGQRQVESGALNWHYVGAAR